MRQHKHLSPMSCFHFPAAQSRAGLFLFKSEPGLAQGGSPDAPRIFLPSLLPS